MLSELCDQLCTVTRRTWSNDQGERTASNATAQLYMAVQPMRASRQQQWGLDMSVTPTSCYCDQDPAVNVDDTITTPDGRILLVLGPADDMGGKGEAYAVDCKRAV